MLYLLISIFSCDFLQDDELEIANLKAESKHLLGKYN